MQEAEKFPERCKNSDAVQKHCLVDGVFPSDTSYFYSVYIYCSNTAHMLQYFLRELSRRPKFGTLPALGGFPLPNLRHLD